MSRWRTSRCGFMAAAVTASLALSACGGGARQDAKESNGNYTVEITSATFPTSQRLSERTHLLIAVRNAGSKTIPNVAVTITDPSLQSASSTAAFGAYLSGPSLASHSRPVWIVDQPPGPCGYSCKSGGPGGAVSAYSNTWALGALKPGATARFDWGLTAVKPGTHEVQYRVAAGLNGNAKAQLAGGAAAVGTFTVTINHAPEQSYVNNQGQVVKAP